MDGDTLRARRVAAMTRVTVVVPTLDERDAVDHLAGLREDVLAGVADRFLVVDGGSTDGTPASLAAQGVEVVLAADLDPGPPVLGKGDQVWRALGLVETEVVVLLDADVRPFDAAMVAALAAPVTNGTALLSKGTFARRCDGVAFHGRITEYTARPSLRLLWPELAAFPEPLSGQAALRRDVARALPTWTGYGLEVGMLVTIASRFGVDAIAQVDLGDIDHGSHDDAFLKAMADDVAAALLGATAHVPLAPSAETHVLGHHGHLVVRPPHAEVS